MDIPAPLCWYSYWNSNKVPITSNYSMLSNELLSSDSYLIVQWDLMYYFNTTFCQKLLFIQNENKESATDQFQSYLSTIRHKFLLRLLYSFDRACKLTLIYIILQRSASSLHLDSWRRAIWNSNPECHVNSLRPTAHFPVCKKLILLQKL